VSPRPGTRTRWPRVPPAWRRRGGDAGRSADLEHAVRGQLTVLIGELELVLGRDEVPAAQREASARRATDAAWAIENMLAGTAAGTGAGPPLPGQPSAPTGRWRRLRSLSLTTRFTAVAATLIVAIGLLVNQVTDRTLQDSALADEAAFASNTVATRLVPFLRAADLEEALSGPRFAEIDRRIREVARDDPDRVGIVLWRADRSIAYSSDSQVIGRQAVDDDELVAALAGVAQRETKPARDAEIRLDRAGLARVMEVYLPLRLDGTRVNGVFEIYHDPTHSDRTVAEADRQISRVLFAGLGILLLVLLVVVRGASAQLRRQSEQLVAIESRREADRLQTEFVGVVSHELRTPLTALVGFSELLLTRDVPEANRRQWTELLHSGAERLRHLVEELLDVTRIGEGGMEVRPAPMDVADAVRDTLAAYGPVPAHVQLVNSVQPGQLPPVLADHDRLVQILTNLVSNAVKYSPGGGRVEVLARVAGSGLRLSVTDEGLGITSDELPRVFSRFHRIDDENRRGIGGTGLGLYIAQQLVELQGGTMSVDSPGIGQGSRFHVTLPLQPQRRA